MALVQSLNITPNYGIDLNTVPPDLFVIQFEVHHVITNLRLHQSPVGSFFWEEQIARFATDSASLQVPCGVLLTEDIRIPVQEIYNVLENLSIPWAAHSLIIQEIYSNAARLERESWQNWRRIRPIMVEIGVVPFDVNQMDDDDDDELIWLMEELGEPRPVYKAASRSSIEELEKTSAGPSLMGSSCSVCLEEFEVGSEVARMPCSHYYHIGCIVEWLEKSHLCPLCRFQMPVDSDWQ